MKKVVAILVSMLMMVAVLGTLCSTFAEEEVGLKIGQENLVNGMATIEAEGDNYKDTVNIGFYQDVTAIDPQLATQTTPTLGTYYHFTHSNLTAVDAEGNPYGLLAESWEQEDDTTMVFKLRQGVKFHNGEELKASDVVFTVTRAQELGTQSLQKAFSAIESAEARDDYTVVFHLKSANMDLLYSLAEPTAGIVSEKALADDPDYGGKIGTGPWVLSEYESGSFYKLTRFDDYFGELPPTQTINIRIVEEDSARIIALQTGEVDLMTMVPNSAIATIEADPNMSMSTYVDAKCAQLAFNCKDDVFSDKNLRLAIAHDLNYEEIAYAARDGYAEVANTFWGKITYGYNDNIEQYEYNPELAHEYLAKSNYPDGCDMEITVVQDEQIRAAAVIQAMLMDLNINVTVNKVDFAAYSAFVNPTDPQHDAVVTTSNWSYNGDGCRAHFGKNSSSNVTAFDNDEVYQLIDDAVAETDSEARKAMYERLQEITYEECTRIPLYYGNYTIGYYTNVGGATFAQTGWHDLSQIYVVAD